ncbi:DUF883 C-terminal domain-containing protein [Candidatus Methylobacter oryzae]|uniref:DUF883 family protein n=1 Tax=Candidatus Methylobacter oryzae TaxID=2497749 RepID=A0ABY3C6N8_9GAMM|nr:DUF883 C-terminal domain-containing protein [Candidatus Methylobacter oryzae]TRW91255.1 DUF883 family protein [Candidatus Methylobacter oryzae]
MDTLEKAADYAHDAADKVADATHYAAKALNEKGEQWLDAEQKLLKDCRAYIRDNPITSLAIVLAAGFVLGRLLNGR